ncbi:MAG: DNA gyrase inhibitor YacG [Bauldia sp.]|uniref:DNA gyrase inhibitor YacG n=1 Tax=Bauldia sp. TaxID=2575872 RepID=UPI001E16FE95|nr:DNA gyrase inhibitor YacG [Bauldia sp.]MCB1494408.1 DNA gyrase inhibitor YacG [Bauldia sp.]
MADGEEEGGPARAGGEVIPLRPRRACPICGKPADRTMFPFCSRRCADVDLNRWLSGAYAIPGVEGDEDDEDGAPSSG